jgi:hypothetical protein
VPGRVDRAVFFGARSLLGITLDDQPAVGLTASVVSHCAPSVGSRVEVTVSGSVLAYPAPAA